MDIEHGKPVPTAENGRRRSYGFERMQVGDSVYADKSHAKRLHNATRVWKHRFIGEGWDYKMERDAEGGVTIWRVR